MLRQGIFIPGVTLTYFFTTLEPSIFFSLLTRKIKIRTISQKRDNEMDTDSTYIAIAGSSVENVVNPELKEEFERQGERQLAS